MRLERILDQLGFNRCLVSSRQMVDKQIKSDANFDILSYMKEKMSYAIGKEIAKRDDLITFYEHDDEFQDGYHGEVFVFSRKELKELIEKLIENR